MSVEIPPYIAEHMPHPSKVNDGADAHGTRGCPLSEQTGYQRDSQGNVLYDLPEVSVRPAVPHNAHRFGAGMYLICHGIPGIVPMTPRSVHEKALVEAETYLKSAREQEQRARQYIELLLARRQRLTVLIEVTRSLEVD